MVVWCAVTEERWSILDKLSLISMFFSILVYILLFISAPSSHLLFKGYLTKKNRREDCTFQRCIKDFLSTRSMLTYLSLGCETTWVCLQLNQLDVRLILSFPIRPPCCVVILAPAVTFWLLFQWSVLIIDLESLAGELFKGISTLDAISLYASCKIRRIFAMKSAASADGDVTRPMVPCVSVSVLCSRISGASLFDLFDLIWTLSLTEETMARLIPCSYQFPPNVIYTTRVLNMKNLLWAKISKNILINFSLACMCAALGTLGNVWGTFNVTGKFPHKLVVGPDI